MNLKTTLLNQAINPRASAKKSHHLSASQSYGFDKYPPLDRTKFSAIELERRVGAKYLWEYLDESKSTFYARMKESEPSFDPLFPSPHPTSTRGIGPKRWKLGDVIAWLHICQAAANDSE